MKKRNSTGHEHAWRMVSPHPFGRVVRYECTSCTAKKEIGSLSGPSRFSSS